MKTSSSFKLFLLSTILIACGTSSSKDSSAAATSSQVSALIINTADVVAVGTVGESSGLQLTGDNSSSSVGLTAEGKIVSDILSVDVEGFNVTQIIAAGDGSILVGASIRQPAVNGTPTGETLDIQLPNGKFLVADCGAPGAGNTGMLRIKGNSADCLVNGYADEIVKADAKSAFYGVLDNTQLLKFDKLGNIFIASNAIYRLNSDGIGSFVAQSIDGSSTLELWGVTDNGTAIVSLTTSSGSVTRVYPLSGSAKSIAGYPMTRAENYIVTDKGLYTSTGEDLKISGLQTMTYVTSLLNDKELNLVAYDGRILTIDLTAKTLNTQKLSNANDIYAATTVGSAVFYYATIDGLTKVQLGSSDLHLTAGILTESKVEGLDDVAILSMAAVGEKLIFSGQNDSTRGYVTGVINGATAQASDVEVKVIDIQAL